MSFLKYISNILFNDPNFIRIQFGWVNYSFVFLIILIVVFIFQQHKQKNNLRTFSSKNQIKHLLPNLSKNRSIIRFTIWAIGFSLLIIGVSNLQFGDKKQTLKKSGINLIICLDVSKSMMAEDIKPYRLKRAKLAINKIINNLGSDRIGIVVFAGDAYLQLPLTSDHSAAEIYIDNISTDLIPIQGTNIANALELAIESFPKGSPTNKAVVIISDGEEHDGKAVELAKNASEDNIKVYTIGLGSKIGTTIPKYKNGKKSGIKKDRNGSAIITRLNETTLQEIAKAGKGKYVHGINSTIGLSDVMADIGGIKKTEYDTKEFTSYDSKFQFFIGIGLIIIIIEFLIIRKKGKWLNS